MRKVALITLIGILALAITACSSTPSKEANGEASTVQVKDEDNKVTSEDVKETAEVKEETAEKPYENISFYKEEDGVDTLRLYVDPNYTLSLVETVTALDLESTINTIGESGVNINTLDYDNLKEHLTVTGVVLLEGEAVGIATETELIREDGTANSAWLMRLNKEGMSGYILVEQIEDPEKAMAGMENIAAKTVDGKETTDTYLHMTAFNTSIPYASGDLAKYQGGTFTEYNFFNQEEPSRGGIIVEYSTAKIESDIELYESINQFKTSNYESEQPFRLYITEETLLTRTDSIESFSVPNTVNKLPGSDVNINTLDYPALKEHLTTSAVAMNEDGEVIGIVTETEIILENGDANSVWMVRINDGVHTGFLIVDQVESPKSAQENLKEVEVTLEDGSTVTDMYAPMTVPGTTVQIASGAFEHYLGATFTEYTVFNQDQPSRGGVVLEFIPNVDK